MLTDGKIADRPNIASDCGVSPHTVGNCIQVLADMLLAPWVPSHRSHPKRRVIRELKFCLTDTGPVNRLARGSPLAPGFRLYWKRFEKWARHELSGWIRSRGCDGRLSYWRLVGGSEVDFVIGEMRLVLEAEATPKIGSHHPRGLRSVVRNHPSIRRRAVVCMEPSARHTSDGIDILPVEEFER